MKISDKRIQELNKLLRKARQRVFDNDRYSKIITICKHRLEYSKPHVRKVSNNYMM